EGAPESAPVTAVAAVPLGALMQEEGSTEGPRAISGKWTLLDPDTLQPLEDGGDVTLNVAFSPGDDAFDDAVASGGAGPAPGPTPEELAEEAQRRAAAEEAEEAARRAAAEEAE
ncbi:unnamed protein product, partial [Symbiodinium sp. KB8]